MPVRSRSLAAAVVVDLREKMAFVGGPRQVGKTTLATELFAKSFGGLAYFNSDNR